MWRSVVVLAVLVTHSAAYFAAPYPSLPAPDAVACDIDGDGDLDTIAATSSTTVFFPRSLVWFETTELALATVAWRFHPPQHDVLTWPSGKVGPDTAVRLACADLDGDGRVEVVVGGAGGVLEVRQPWLNASSAEDVLAGGGRRVRVAELPESAEVAHVDVVELNGDEWPDLVVEQSQSNASVLVFYSTGPLQYAEAQVVGMNAQRLRSLTFGDVNNDGHVDMVAVRGRCKVVVCENVGGRLSDVCREVNNTCEESVLGVALVAWRGEEVLDLLVDSENHVRVLLGDGHGGFVEGSTDLRFELGAARNDDEVRPVVGNLTGRGVPDVLLSRGLVMPAQIDGQLSLQNATVLDLRWCWKMANHVVDLNQDGRPDVLQTCEFVDHRWHINEGPPYTWCPEGEGATVAAPHTCSPCQPGASTLQGMGCMPCSPGSFATTPGSSSCTPCNRSATSERGATACFSCGRGMVRDEDSAECRPCAAGRFHMDPVGMCVDCMSGQSSDEGATACRDCTPGRFAQTYGSPACELCPAGRYSEYPRAWTCSACPEGTFFPTTGAASWETCESCPAGTSSQQGQATCTDCLAGKYARPRADRCQACSPGRFSTQPRQGECNLCELGTYQDAYQATACKACPPGKSSPPGSPSALSCAQVGARARHPGGSSWGSEVVALVAGGMSICALSMALYMYCREEQRRQGYERVELAGVVDAVEDAVEEVVEAEADDIVDDSEDAVI